MSENKDNVVDARQDFRVRRAEGVEGGRSSMIVCSPRCYQYRGIIIECSGIGGPWACNKKGEPYVRYPRHVAAAIDEFFSLTEEEQAKHRLGGGCVFVGEGNSAKK